MSVVYGKRVFMNLDSVKGWGKGGRNIVQESMSP